MPMRKILIVLAAVLWLAAAGQAEAQKKAKQAATGGPRLALAQASFDAGEVAPDTPVSHDFIVKNTGGEELKIIKVVPSCGCTVASFDQAIAPGASGKVTLTMRIYADGAGRRVTQSASMETNDPQAQYVSLTLSAHVKTK